MVEKNKDNPTLLFLVVGPSQCGKTALLSKIREKDFNDAPVLTEGEERANLKLKGLRYTIKLEAYSGENHFFQIVFNEANKYDAFIMMYDITNDNSLKYLEDKLQIIKRNITDNKEPILFMIGNKTDLENKRVVSIEDALRFCENNSINHIGQISVKNSSKMELENMMRAMIELIPKPKQVKKTVGKDIDNYYKFC